MEDRAIAAEKELEDLKQFVRELIGTIEINDPTEGIIIKLTILMSKVK